MATAMAKHYLPQQDSRRDETIQVNSDWLASAAETRTDRQHGRCPQDVINDGSWSFDSRCLAVISLSVRLNATKSFEVDVCTHRHVRDASVDVCDLRQRCLCTLVTDDATGGGIRTFLPRTSGLLPSLATINYLNVKKLLIISIYG